MLLDKNEINTGRQFEFDYLKGLFIPMILFIHAFQMLDGTANPVYRFIYVFCTLTGSTIFLFVMGLGSMYSKRSPGRLAVDGLKLLLWQLLWNLFSMLLPLIIGQGIRAGLGLSMECFETAKMFAKMSVEYINIFFIAGVSYLLLALLKLLKCSGTGYLILAIIFTVMSPALYMTDQKTGIEVLDYILTMFAGGRMAVSLCFLPNFAYVMWGAWFGLILRRCPDKGKLYSVLSPGAFVLVAAYFITMLVSHENLNAFYTSFDFEYVFPGTFRMLANVSCTLLCAAVLYELYPVISSAKRADNALMHISRKTSQYYAIHPFFYMLVFSVKGFTSSGFLLCFAIFIVTSVGCFYVIKLYDLLLKKFTAKFKKF